MKNPAVDEKMRSPPLPSAGRGGEEIEADAFRVESP